MVHISCKCDSQDSKDESIRTGILRLLRSETLFAYHRSSTPHSVAGKLPGSIIRSGSQTTGIRADQRASGDATTFGNGNRAERPDSLQLTIKM